MILLGVCLNPFTFASALETLVPPCAFLFFEPCARQFLHTCARSFLEKPCATLCHLVPKPCAHNFQKPCAGTFLHTCAGGAAAAQGVHKTPGLGKNRAAGSCFYLPQHMESQIVVSPGIPPKSIDFSLFFPSICAVKMTLKTEPQITIKLGFHQDRNPNLFFCHSDTPNGAHKP